MKKLITGKVRLTISIILIFSLASAIIVFAVGRNKHNTPHTTNQDSQSEEMSIEMSLKSENGKMINQKFKFDESELFGNETAYNHKLALSSFAMAVSAFSAGDSSGSWGNDGDFGREQTLRKAFDDLKLGHQKFVGYDVSLNDGSSKAAFGIASRDITHQNENYTLVAIAVRGGGYGAEWADNFVIGSDEHKYHKGFEASADKIKAYADDYIQNYCSGKRVRLWITGYSRGAAVANILASKFNSSADDNLSLFAYTFATPNTVISDKNAQDSNIFNIINPYDAVTLLPPAEWGFGRAGNSITFPSKTDEAASRSMYAKVSAEYQKMTGQEYNMVSGDGLKALIEVMISLANSRNEYTDRYEPVFKDMMFFLMTKTKQDNEWKRMSFNDYIVKKYGKKAEKAISKMTVGDNMSSIKEIGIKVPDELTYFLILCEIHGISEADSVFINSFSLETVKKLFKTLSEGGINLNTKPHRPETYLAWLNSYNLAEICNF